MTNNSSHSLWPAALIGFFAVFITFLVSFGIFASRQRIDLVRADYYDHEIRFQKHIETVRRTEALPEKTDIIYEAEHGLVRFTLPSTHTIEEGAVKFYRPSNASLDHEASLRSIIAAGGALDVSKLQPGLWKVRLSWKAAGEEYQLERPVVLAGP